ncbi:MAG: hypothetical protein SAK29_37790 [Scytonema sp. PMC 1069.18]|nr:hypothetical protein [Scytonema sp. PMC 1069.18]MEC4885015.1 hypothetical protein [Scytonema sp. PMC 1070.18]
MELFVAFNSILGSTCHGNKLIQPEEYINVPAGTEHWFYLTSAQRIKAVRYFTGTQGWVPQYTGKEKTILLSKFCNTINSKSERTV